MPAFAYQVRNREGKKINGVIEAPSEKMVADLLAQEGYFITAIKPAQRFRFSFDLTIGGPRISADDLTMFYFQLGNMIEVGVPLLAALQSVMDQMANSFLRKTIQDLVNRVQGGASISEAMSHHAKVFPSLYRSMIGVGETSGKLAETFRHVAELNEARSELKHQVQSALAYPTVLVFASVAVIVFMTVWIIPTFTEIFNKADIPLPLPTRILYGLSQFIKGNPISLIVVIVSGLIGCRMLLQLPSVKFYWDQFWLSVPVVGLLIRRIEVVRWSKNMALMLSSGVPISQALEITKNLTGNALFREALVTAHTAVQGGGKIADTLQKSRVFPTDVIQMVSTGENSGTLDKMLYKTANFYDQLVSRTLKKLTAMMEPTFLLVMGSIVAFIMTSVLLPIFDMIKLVGAH